ncbi:MAG TPA: cupin [Spirochaetota bacterium]|nr:cupin [Spirochaetota bacterium]HPC40504.1 cupin [Spirochaetota bacterium]HPL17438.1 cupin [Spirochaetota bacterium]HQF07988.1 cupin [Spirochaetota bacterium]HQH96548.1 cupin [Spirochaetota bacterium]
MICKKSNFFYLEKHGVSMRLYNDLTDCPHAAVAYQETAAGRAEESYHEKSAFIYYNIEGSDTWIIEDVEYPVDKDDVVIVPPGKRFYFKGNLKQLCITVPAWEEQFGHHVRIVTVP